MNQKGEMLVEFVYHINMENLNKTLTEGHVMGSARNHESAVDYMLANGRMRETVSRMWVYDE